MYEDLDKIATLKFGKEMESISVQTRDRVREMQNEYAARSGASGGRSGQQEAAIGRAQMEGAERLVQRFFEIWVDLVKRSKGHLDQKDIGFILPKVEGLAQSQVRNLRTAFHQQRAGAVVNVLAQEADLRMTAAAANARRELNIMVREHEAFSNEAKTRDGSTRIDMEGKLTRRSAELLNILIASPSDVVEERDVVERVILDWNASHLASTGVMLHPVRWESHAYPASGDHPQSLINRQIVDSGDILIGIFGYKLGTPTDKAQSGTIEEIEEFRAAGKYVALYFSTADVPRSADRDQLAALARYKVDRQKDTLYFDFEDATALRNHLTRHLPKIVADVRGQIGSRSTVTQPTVEPQSPSSLMLADLISELEDNFDCASRPRTGDTYRRPSSREWLENRNKLSLPSDLLSDLKTTYNRISSWADMVASGLSPNIGSAALEMIVSDLRMSLPSLIERLRRNLNHSGKGSK
ncbi:DUF4062 domain-containing protein [Granulicella arctica]|uniref:DUF4062 domain-containing protein n=1 Tax=Granulicella arctica TaxID=940613 RepID=UPI0021E0AD17|nr:DUF4062 domain-containing protein [Granulicella arctica]